MLCVRLENWERREGNITLKRKQTIRSKAETKREAEKKKRGEEVEREGKKGENKIKRSWTEFVLNPFLPNRRRNITKQATRLQSRSKIAYWQI